jgi:hypothetical protein
MWGCGAALRGLTPHAALSMSWSFATPRKAKHHGASPSSTYVSATEMLRAARGVSPFKRPAAPLRSLPTVRFEPHVSTWGRRVAQPRSVSPRPNAHRPPPLPTPMHHAYRLSPPQCTTPTASSHPDAQRSPPLPTPTICTPKDVMTHKAEAGAHSHIAAIRAKRRRAQPRRVVCSPFGRRTDSVGVGCLRAVRRSWRRPRRVRTGVHTPSWATRVRRHAQRGQPAHSH